MQRPGRQQPPPHGGGGAAAAAAGGGGAGDQQTSAQQRQMQMQQQDREERRKAPRPPDNPNTELARLLGNRTRALMLFEDGAFDAGAFLDAYFAPLGEKAAANAARDLGALLDACGGEVAGVVAAHHGRFLEACSGVEALEDHVALLRNYANGLTALVASLRAALRDQRGQAGGGGAVGSPSRLAALFEPPSPGAGDSDDADGGAAAPLPPVARIEADLELLLRRLDLACAQRDLPAAVAWLRAAERVGALLDRDAPQLVLEVGDFPGWRHGYDAAVRLRKQQLAAALQAQLASANAGGAEIRAAARALSALVGEAPALAAVLACRGAKIRAAQAAALRQHASGALDPDGAEFAGALCQRTLLEVGAAADDLVAIFGAGAREPAALFATWAAREGKAAAALLRRHVLSPAAAASTGLQTTVQVVAAALVFCAMLEQSHQVSLTAAVTAELWPSVEAALRRHAKRAADELRMGAGEEAAALAAACSSGGGGGGYGGGVAGAQPVTEAASSLTLTCGSLVREVSLLADLCAPIASPKLASCLRGAVLDLFGAAVRAVAQELRGFVRHGGRDAASALAPQLPLVMEALALLAEQGLPSATAPFAAHAGPVVDAPAMGRLLSDMYRDVQAAAKAAAAKAGGGGGGVGGGGGGAQV